MAGEKKMLIAAVIALIGLIAFGGPALAGAMLSGTPLTGAAEVDRREPGPG